MAVVVVAVVVVVTTVVLVQTTHPVTMVRTVWTSSWRPSHHSVTARSSSGFTSPIDGVWVHGGGVGGVGVAGGVAGCMGVCTHDCYEEESICHPLL